MAIGPGKYDDLCTIVREEAEASLALVIVVKGKKGSGFSVQGKDLSDLVWLPAVLRETANQIEQSGGTA